MAAKKQWSIPTVLRQLRRVVAEAIDLDIMAGENSPYTVETMVNDLTLHHMNKQMEIPGQTSIPVDVPKDKK